MMLVSGLITRALGAVTGLPLLAYPLAAALAWGAWGHWQAHTARTDLAELRAAVATSDRDAAVRSEGQGRIAHAAAERYATQRAAKESRHAETRVALRKALGGPIPGRPGQVGDVLLPAAAVDRLRDSAAGDSPGGAGAAAGVPGR